MSCRQKRGSRIFRKYARVVLTIASHDYLTQLGANVTLTPALPTEPIELKNQVYGVSIMAVNRWTDEMLDRLADSVSELRAAVSDLQTSVSELRTSLEALVQAFIQEHEENRQHRQEMRAWQRQMEEWRQENDLRFNILLEEIRASNQRIKRLEDAQNNPNSE